MASSTVLKRSATAAAANTDTTVFTPASGQRVRLLAFWVVNEAAAQAAGMAFELRYGSNIIAAVGFMVAAAPIGQMSNEAILNHELVGDGATAVVVRNLVALAASSDAIYNISYDANYTPTGP